MILLSSDQNACQTYDFEMGAGVRSRQSGGVSAFRFISKSFTMYKSQ